MAVGFEPTVAVTTHAFEAGAARDGAGEAGKAGALAGAAEAAGVLRVVRAEVAGVLDQVAAGRLAELAAALDHPGRTFVTGEGRSGFLAGALAMRLMHLGMRVHRVGEATAPAVAGGDLLVAVSGSGATAGTVRVAQQARAAGARVAAVTADPGSPLATAADLTLHVPAATKDRSPGQPPTVQPLSSLFDQAAHLLLDATCLLLARRRGVGEAAARAAHANTE